MSYLQNFKYEIQGDPEHKKIVFLHGVMGSGANWRKITPALSRHYQILTFDQRGHGWSFKPEQGYGPEDYALDLKLILEELGWNQIALVGHSMGGRNALFFSYKYPQFIKALVVEDIGPEGNKSAMQTTIDRVEMVPTPFSDKIAAKLYFENEFPAQLGGGAGAKILSQYFYTNIEQKQNGQADWRFSKKAILSTLIDGHFKPRWDLVRDLSVPTLFIRGEHSKDFPREEYDKVLSLNSKISGIEIKNSGHWVHFDQPLEFIEQIRNFFMKIGF